MDTQERLSTPDEMTSRPVVVMLAKGEDDLIDIWQAVQQTNAAEGDKPNLTFHAPDTGNEPEVGEAIEAYARYRAEFEQEKRGESQLSISDQFIKDVSRFTREAIECTKSGGSIAIIGIIEGDKSDDESSDTSTEKRKRAIELFQTGYSWLVHKTDEEQKLEEEHQKRMERIAQRMAEGHLVINYVS